VLKRLFDIFLSSIGLILSSPLWLIFSLAIKSEDRGPIFYTQEQVGKSGNIFKALKFRSMIKDAEKESGPVQAGENDPRVTKIGRILRATAMDELPQLWNIFKGDMSFVGPRALRPKEKEVHGNPDETDIEKIPGYQGRLAVRPGLTGMAQIDPISYQKNEY
jgi:lipopolysaccharide/colanic/teichoic acid biosynthesis glycosyltransferase